ncbi:terminase large subunit domain-containing protein [Spirosoma sp. 209]|uniref:terminase large subunit domain-containing protein n=1 Tax=Spirosoma sp. 209 TaxID=1955701 RepID=UPI00098D3BF5|nr:terminase family protein [Spirosoma sp. 209]
MASDADILIGGASAGVGKSYVLCLEDLYHVDNPQFGSVTFRRTKPQIRAKGGLWDTSSEIYPHLGATPRQNELEWVFPSGATAKFASLQYEQDVLNWQGSQIPLIKFDELTHFTKSMFWYMISRNRSTCGVKPYVRATCNPDSESWVYELIKWWIDPETGYPIPERDGVIRYLVKHGDDYIWGDTKQEVIEAAWFFIGPLVEKSGQAAEDFVKSVTFVSGSIYDNRALLGKDPGYLANLAAQDEQIRLQLQDGCWKPAPSDLDIYDYASFCGLFDNLRNVDEVGRYITADIAGKGSNKFIVGAWHGWKLADIAILDKSDGPKVVETIGNMAKLHNVPNRHITFDADGIGGLYEGFAPGAIAFHNGAAPLEARDDAGKKVKENYFNLKTQCFYRTANRTKQGDMAIAEHVANQMYDTKMTVRQRFMHERKVIKRDKPDSDGKLRVIPKDQMRVKLGGNGESPDLMDMFCMREIFDLKPKARQWAVH